MVSFVLQSIPAMRKFLCLIILMASLSASAICIGKSKTTSNLPYVKTFSEADVRPNANGWSFWFIPTGGVADTLNLKMSHVDKGASLHGGHVHNHDEIFIVTEGKAIVNMNGEECTLDVGDAVYCPSGSNHSIRRAGTNAPVSYIMFNRIINGGIKTPYPFWKADYKMEDCHTRFEKDASFWYLRPEQTLGGLNIRSVLTDKGKTLKYAADGKQMVIFVMDGTADITVTGKETGRCQTVRLPAMSVCYVPKGAGCTVKAIGGKLRFIEARTH